ncbi:two-component sensor histidine kinase [Sphingobium sp. LB126]|uniref:HAMP domain-containing sensor histidine kinase n=1 Tax=Sphingobium sp. LB126 TaxID=1983755 RepID=UPI000C1FF8AE|nr:HAMP domain-containing sensor histidine kinase [Sphingobium sp. LB126]PJG45982.1 two-component sensor histidine kinase [Sphingobium sp. LB126]
MRLRSLRALTLAFLAVFLGATLATAFGIYFATFRTIDHLVEQRIASASAAIAPEGERAQARRIGLRIMAAARERDTGDLGFILFDHGSQVAGNVRVTRPLPLGLSQVDVADRIKGLSHGKVLTRDLGDGLRLAVIAETEPFDHYNAARKRIYLIGFGSIIAIALAAATTFTLIVRRRITDMRTTVEAIFDGDMTQRVPVDGSGTAFDRQAVAFNRMLDRIGALMEEMGHVTNGVAHELRTPLARLRNQLSLLARDPQAQAVRDRIEDAQAEADRLLGLFAALLRIAEVESGARRADFAPVDLKALVEDSVEALEPVIEESGHRIAGLALAEARIVGDGQLLTQMVVNLVENILRHTPGGTEIGITLEAGEGGTVLSVADDGPGIAAQDRAKALDRFGRLSGGGQVKGYGFGLPLVAAIARLHGGTLELEDARPGLLARVILPGA